jgi:hypothetical protein
MNRTGLLAVLLLTALLFVIAALLPEEDISPQIDTPWNVTVTADGSSHLLGITLGESTIDQAQQHWKEAPEITLFIPEQGSPKVEAYFQQVALGGIRASIVAEVTVAAAELQQLIAQGARIATQGDGSRKVTLDGEGTTIVEQSPISSLTYLPKADLSPEIIRKRFGLPTHTFRLEQERIEHWIYPLIGLDLVLSEETREVLQFVPPREIERLLKPLQVRDDAPAAQPPA